VYILTNALTESYMEEKSIDLGEQLITTFLHY